MFSFSATYLLRAIIEQATTQYFKKRGITVDGELHKKLSKLATILSESGMKDRELKTLRVMSNDKDSHYSPDTLGHFIHGGAIPSHVLGIKLWDSIEPVMTRILDELNK